MDYYYAQIGADGFCYAVSQLAGEVDDENCVRVESYDLSYLGKCYKDGGWVNIKC